MNQVRNIQFSEGGNFYSLYLSDEEFSYVLTQGELLDGTGVASVKFEGAMIFNLRDKAWRLHDALHQKAMPTLRSEERKEGERSKGLEEALQEGLNEEELEEAVELFAGMFGVEVEER